MEMWGVQQKIHPAPGEALSTRCVHGLWKGRLYDG